MVPSEKQIEISAGAPVGIKSRTPVVLIVDDQEIIVEAIRKMLSDEKDIVVYSCTDPAKALQVASECSPTVILQDLVMPDIDGMTLLRYYRSFDATKDVPVIVLTSKEEATTKAEAFGLGANDYLVKLPDKVELIARIRHHSKSYVRLLQRNEAYAKLAESQKQLSTELADAAAYVKSLLPNPLTGVVKTSWEYIPSTQLGGDSFGYHWIDPDHLAIYLLDVCGHGVGAALLSISIINVLRSQSLMNTDFTKPHDVLQVLNSNFPMETNNGMFFTIWYGVYNKIKKELSYASGGHPPAILFTGDQPDSLEIVKLSTHGLVIGFTTGGKFVSATCSLKKYNTLYIYSDGVYEIDVPGGQMLDLQDLIAVMAQPSIKGVADTERILNYMQEQKGPGPFADDFSLLQVVF